MIADIVIGALVFIVVVSHIHWRVRFGERLAELDRSTEKMSERLAEKEPEMRFPKNERGEENYLRNGGYWSHGRDIEEIYFFFLPISRVVKDLMDHTGMQYKYEEEKPKKIEAIKKPVARKRK